MCCNCWARFTLNSLSRNKCRRDEIKMNSIKRIKSFLSTKTELLSLGFSMANFSLTLHIFPSFSIYLEIFMKKFKKNYEILIWIIVKKPQFYFYPLISLKNEKKKFGKLKGLQGIKKNLSNDHPNENFSELKSFEIFVENFYRFFWKKQNYSNSS